MTKPTPTQARILRILASGGRLETRPGQSSHRLYDDQERCRGFVLARTVDKMIAAGLLDEELRPREQR